MIKKALKGAYYYSAPLAGAAGCLMAICIPIIKQILKDIAKGGLLRPRRWPLLLPGLALAAYYPATYADAFIDGEVKTASILV